MDLGELVPVLLSRGRPHQSQSTPVSPTRGQCCSAEWRWEHIPAVRGLSVWGKTELREELGGETPKSLNRSKSPVFCCAFFFF